MFTIIHYIYRYIYRGIELFIRIDVGPPWVLKYCVSEVPRYPYTNYVGLDIPRSWLLVIMILLSYSYFMIILFESFQPMVFIILALITPGY